MTFGATGSGAPFGASATDRVGGVSANSATFTDASGDGVGGAPDVTTVRVSNDDRGKLRFEVTLANRVDLTDVDHISVLLDIDRASATGCNLGPIGVDRSIFVRGKPEPETRRRSDHLPLGGVRIRPCPSFPDAGYQRNLHRLDTHDRAGCVYLGPPAPTGFRFAIVAQIDPVPEQKWDIAPSQFAWAYDIKVSTDRPADRSPPRVRALPSSGSHGGVAKLRYSVFDESKKTREEIRVLRGSQLLTVMRTKLGLRNVAAIYTARWRVPTQAQSGLRFCVRAWDAAGNRSAPSCSALKIR